MASEHLRPDALELSICLRVGVIATCPFCGGHAHLGSKVNETPAMSSGPLFQGSISCVDIDCMATVFYNAKTREAAQQGVIERWSRRHTTPAADE